MGAVTSHLNMGQVYHNVTAAAREIEGDCEGRKAERERDGPRKVSHYSYFSGKLPPASTVMVTKIPQRKRERRRGPFEPVTRYTIGDGYHKFQCWLGCTVVLLL